MNGDHKNMYSNDSNRNPATGEINSSYSAPIIDYNHSFPTRCDQPSLISNSINKQSQHKSELSNFSNYNISQNDTRQPNNTASVPGEAIKNNSYNVMYTDQYHPVYYLVPQANFYIPQCVPMVQQPSLAQHQSQNITNNTEENNSAIPYYYHPGLYNIQGQLYSISDSNVPQNLANMQQTGDVYNIDYSSKSEMVQNVQHFQQQLPNNQNDDTICFDKNYDQSETQSLPSRNNEDGDTDGNSSDDDRLNTVHGEEMLQGMQSIACFSDIVKVPTSNSKSEILKTNKDSAQVNNAPGSVTSEPVESSTSSCSSRFKKTRIKERTNVWNCDTIHTVDTFVTIIPDNVRSMNPYNLEELNSLLIQKNEIEKEIYQSEDSPDSSNENGYDNELTLSKKLIKDQHPKCIHEEQSPQSSEYSPNELKYKNECGTRSSIQWNSTNSASTPTPTIDTKSYFTMATSPASPALGNSSPNISSTNNFHRSSFSYGPAIIQMRQPGVAIITSSPASSPMTRTILKATSHITPATSFAPISSNTFVATPLQRPPRPTSHDTTIPHVFRTSSVHNKPYQYNYSKSTGGRHRNGSSHNNCNPSIKNNRARRWSVSNNSESDKNNPYDGTIPNGSFFKYNSDDISFDNSYYSSKMSKKQSTSTNNTSSDYFHDAENDLNSPLRDSSIQSHFLPSNVKEFDKLIEDQIESFKKSVINQVDGYLWRQYQEINQLNAKNSELTSQLNKETNRLQGLEDAIRKNLPKEDWVKYGVN